MGFDCLSDEVVVIVDCLCESAFRTEGKSAVGIFQNKARVTFVDVVRIICTMEIGKV